MNHGEYEIRRLIDARDGAAGLTPISMDMSVRGCKLLWVQSPYKLGSDAREDLGQTRAPRATANRCKKAGKQVFSMCDRRYVREEDVC